MMKLTQLLLATGMSLFAMGAQAVTNTTPFGGDMVDMSFARNSWPSSLFEGYIIPEDGTAQTYFLMGPSMRIQVSSSKITLDALSWANYWSEERDFFHGLVIQNKYDTLDGFTWQIAVNQGFSGFDLSKLSQAGDTLKLNLLDVVIDQGGQLVLTATPVPEPSTMAMTLVGLAGCGLAGRAVRNTRRQRVD